MKLFKSNNDFYLIVDKIDESDLYFMHKTDDNRGILKLKKIHLEHLYSEFWYAKECLDNHCKQLKKDVTEGKSFCFLSEAKDDARLLFIFDEHELSDFVQNHESIYSMQVSTNCITIV